MAWVCGRAASGQEQEIFGLFTDKKDVHYQVTKARRDLGVKAGIVEGFLVPVDCQISPSAELLALREKVANCDSANVPLRACVMVKHVGEHYLQVPSPSSLPFEVPSDLHLRLREVIVEYGSPLGPKCKASSLLASPFPLAVAPFGYQKVDSEAVTIAGKAMQIWKLRRHGQSTQDASESSAEVRRESSAEVRRQPGEIPEEIFVLHNASSFRVSLPVRSRVCGLSAGRYFDQRREEEPAMAAGTILWPWSLKLGS